jgi:hypothetical protein
MPTAYDTFNLTDALNNAFSAIERVGAGKLLKARQDAEIARTQAETAQYRQFQADQAQLSRDNSLEINRNNNEAADRRTNATIKANEDRLKAYDKKQEKADLDREKELKDAAGDIERSQRLYNAAQLKGVELVDKRELERRAAIQAETVKRFSSVLSADEKRALKESGGDVQGFIDRIGDKDKQFQFNQALQTAQSKAEELLSDKNFRSSHDREIAQINLDLTSLSTRITNRDKQSPGWTKYATPLPDPAQAPGASAAPSDPFDAAASRAEAQLQQGGAPAAAQPQAPAIPRASVEPAPAPRTVEEAGIFGSLADRAAASRQEIINRVSQERQARSERFGGDKGQGIPALDTFLFGSGPRVNFDPARVNAAERGAFHRNFNPTDYNVPNPVPQLQPQQQRALPAFSPVDFARDQFGIDAANLTPDDQQGMLQLALRDGLSQQDVSSVIERVKQGDPSAIQIVKKYQDQWNATKGARPQAPLDMQAVGLA